MKPLDGNWQHWTNNHAPRRFTCGHCDAVTGTKHASVCSATSRMVDSLIYVCGACNRPTFFEGGWQTPQPNMGSSVDGLPSGGVAELYAELRAAASAGAYTAAVTIARTLLAQVAVNKGAPLKQSFLQYVDWLEKSGYTTAPMKPWVDHIRDQANVSAHELKLMDEVEAGRSVAFAGMLLRIVYEFPAAVPPP